MCVACEVRGVWDDAHLPLVSSEDNAATDSGNERAWAATVSDSRAIEYHYYAGDNWRWNANDPLGTPVTVTYSFVEGGELPSTASYNPYGASGYSAFSDAQRANFRLGAAEFMAASGIVFVEVDQGGMIDVFNAHGSTVGGWAGLPYVTENYTSNVNLVVDSSGDYAPGSYGYFTIIHEIGHAVGLDHTHQGAYRLNATIDTTSNSVMSYNYDSASVGLGWLDEQALENIYGPNLGAGAWSFSYSGARERLLAIGSGGDDTLAGMSGKNRIEGGGGNDTISGNADTDVLRGGAGSDALTGGGGQDFLRGGFGDDALDGGDGDDYVNGGAGNDTLTGGLGNDTLTGRSGADHVDGGAGADLLYGDRGNDRLNGGSGNDTLIGGTGRDILSGGAGADRFVFNASSGADRVTDFEQGVDLLDLRGLGENMGTLSIVQVGGQTVITFGSNEITLDGVSASNLTNDDFMF